MESDLWVVSWEEFISHQSHGATVILSAVWRGLLGESCLIRILKGKKEKSGYVNASALLGKKRKYESLDIRLQSQQTEPVDGEHVEDMEQSDSMTPYERIGKQNLKFSRRLNFVVEKRYGVTKQIKT